MWRALFSIVATVIVIMVLLFTFHLLWWVVHWIAVIAAALIVGYAWGYVDGRHASRKTRSTRR